VHAALGELREAGLVGPETAPALTPSGCDVLDRLVTARRDHLTELAADWNSKRDVDVATYLQRAVRDLIPNARRPA
jgi:hypothetical protein